MPVTSTGMTEGEMLTSPVGCLVALSKKGANVKFPYDLPFSNFSSMAAFVYILASHRNGTLYIGVTAALSKRISDHGSGKGSAVAAKYNVDQLVSVEADDDSRDARARIVR